MDKAIDRYAMDLAVKEAEKAAAMDEVPVGAVILKGEQVIARGHNLTRTNQDATEHAEIVALRRASEVLGTWWLVHTTLYVTLEPCAMCAGAIVLARLPRLVYGARDPKAGACGSLRNIVEDKRLNHRTELIGGLMDKTCGDLLRSFFEEKREKRDQKRGQILS